MKGQTDGRRTDRRRTDGRTERGQTHSVVDDLEGLGLHVQALVCALVVQGVGLEHQAEQRLRALQLHRARGQQDRGLPAPRETRHLKRVQLRR